MSDPFEVESLLAKLREQRVPAGLVELDRLQRAILAQKGSSFDLRRLARSVVVKRPDERRRFERAFDEWHRQAGSILETTERHEADDGTLAPPNPARRVRDVVRRIDAWRASPSSQRRRRWHWLAWIALAAIAIGVAFLGEEDPREPPFQKDSRQREAPAKPEPRDSPAAEPRREPAASVEIPVPVITSRSTREPMPTRAAWLALFALATGLAATALLVFRLRASRLDQPPPDPQPDRERTRPIPWRARESQLLDPETSREMVWGVERFVADEFTERIDLDRTVAATANTAGMPVIVRERPTRDRTLWLWLDSQPSDPKPSRFAGEISAQLERAGLPVRRAFFYGLPSSLRWLDGLGDFTPESMERHREGTIVVLMTDGRGILSALGDNRRAHVAQRLLRHLRQWPQLAIVDFSEERRLTDRLDRLGLRCIAPNELGGFIQRGSESLPDFDAEQGPENAIKPRNRPALEFWAAALALVDQPFDREIAWSMLHELRLDVDPFEVDAILTSPGVVQIGDRFRFEPDARTGRLDWFARAEQHHDESGRFHVRRTSLLARAITLWQARVDDSRHHAERQPGADLRALRLQSALLRLWMAPAEAADELEQLAQDGYAKRVHARLRRLTCAGPPAQGIVCLPWRRADVPNRVWDRLTTLGFAQDVLEPARPRMPATLRIAASTIGCLAAAALLGATGALDRLRVPSDPVITESWAPGVPRVPTRFGRDDDGSWIVATPKHTHLVEQDGETVALASDEAVAVTWATRTRPNPEPNAYGELWLAGFRPRPVRPTAANWPDRSVLAILATEDTQPAWRRFAWEALDRGTFDLVWVGGSAVLSELFRELFLGLPPDDPDAQLVVIAPAGQDLSPAPLPRRYAFVPASKPDQLLLPAEREPRPIRELWPTAQPEDTTAVLASWFPLDMVRIPKGVLRSDDESSPLHNTEVDKFLISRFEVTRGDWFRLGLAEPKNDHGEGFYPKGELPKHPANNVNWFDALQFCNALSDRDGLTPAYYRDEEFTQVWQDRKTDGDTVHWDPNANGYRLPTEAEWEYAIRSNANPPARFYWGSNVERASEFAWFTKNSGDEPQAVDQKLRNDFGLSDMAGNVWEWCWDSYDDSGPGVRRVLRGGAYVVNVEALASSIGSWDRPEFRGRSFGFRCVRSAHPRHGSNR